MRITADPMWTLNCPVPPQSFSHAYELYKIYLQYDQFVSAFTVMMTAYARSNY
jgi:hypothetical protein